MIPTFLPAGNRVTQKNGLKTLLDIQNALIQNIKKPLPGQWRMEVTSEGPHTIRVTGLSTTDFSVGFSRKTVNNMQDTDHRPIGGKLILFDACVENLCY